MHRRRRNVVEVDEVVVVRRVLDRVVRRLLRKLLSRRKLKPTRRVTTRALARVNHEIIVREVDARVARCVRNRRVENVVRRVASHVAQERINRYRRRVRAWLLRDNRADRREDRKRGEYPASALAVAPCRAYRSPPQECKEHRAQDYKRYRRYEVH